MLDGARAYIWGLAVVRGTLIHPRSSSSIKLLIIKCLILAAPRGQGRSWTVPCRSTTIGRKWTASLSFLSGTTKCPRVGRPARQSVGYDTMHISCFVYRASSRKRSRVQQGNLARASAESKAMVEGWHKNETRYYCSPCNFYYCSNKKEPCGTQSYATISDITLVRRPKRWYKQL